MNPLSPAPRSEMPNFSPRSLHEKWVVMTGATSGIGRIVAERLAWRGAKMVFVVRDEAKGRKLVAQIGGEIIVADLASLKSVAQAADQIHEHCPKIDILVNNAGVMKRRRELSPDGFEMSVAINHLAIAALTIRLLGKLNFAGARIVNTTSAGDPKMLADRAEVTADIPTWRGGPDAYDSAAAYDRAKFANLVWGYELAERLRSAGTTLNAVYPGPARTKLRREMPWLCNQAYHLLHSSHARRGAEPLMFLAISPEVAGVSGAYFDCFRNVPSAFQSHDPAVRRAIWDETSRIIGVDYPPNLPSAPQ
ncbi:MAG: SDR family NAD(P)-dependent oxidoreductase [Bradyrhizobium sp.]|nr:SDR family NAD(P)-dependent oxidoreductase [Bradyrhizobium sp.]